MAKDEAERQILAETRRQNSKEPIGPRDAKLLVLSQNRQTRSSGRYEDVIIEVKNTTTKAMTLVSVKVILRDSAGKALKTESIIFGDIDAGESRVGETMIQADPRIEYYDLEFTTGFTSVIPHAIVR